MLDKIITWDDSLATNSRVLIDTLAEPHHDGEKMLKTDTDGN